MKKVFISLAIAAALGSTNLMALDDAGGVDKAKENAGLVSNTTVGIATAVVAIAAATMTGSAAAAPVVIPPVVVPPVEPPVEPPTPTCSGADELVDGVCIASTVTTTVTGTGTATSTTTVVVTSTYAPTI